MKAFTTLTAVAAPIEMANIDTDRIIPVRFLRKLRNEKAGYDPYLFHDMRFDNEGRENPDFVATYTSRPLRNLLDNIYDAGIGLMGSCVTDGDPANAIADGSCVVGEDHAGKYLVIAKYATRLNDKVAIYPLC